mmetsp:Transcript_13158/g.44568  ORF Transcript_13158/g.44568 Transcript_13158/m.44568 type:complete len:311 (+) Transcript_13158:1263-2195(+)
MATASWSVLKVAMGTSGEKVSSPQQRTAGDEWRSTVGAAKGAPSHSAPLAVSERTAGSSGPPKAILAPCFTASATCSSNLSRAPAFTSGPMVTSGSRPWPRRSCSSTRQRRRTNSSSTVSWTRTRFVAMQTCPALRSLEARSARTATSRSASSKTMKGALPPSSSASFFTVGADCSTRSLPTRVEPVKLTMRTRSSAVRVDPMVPACSREAVIVLMTPSGTPASRASWSSTRAESGVASAGFTTAVHPAPRAGATFRVIMAMGKFQGVITPATPMGWRRTRRRLSALAPGMISPFTRRACSANHRTKLAP